MAMLIRGGMIHTMTEQGCFRGDILVRNGKIAAVDEVIKLDGSETTCVLDAEGLTILPGLIDPHIHEGLETDAGVLQHSHASGVTAGLLWPEEEGKCQLLSSKEPSGGDIYAIRPGAHTDEQLREHIEALSDAGFRIACEVHSAQECRRLLSVVESTRVKIILIHLTGCEALAEEIAASGCPAVVGISHAHNGSPWPMVSCLSRLGVQIALTCNHPEAKLRHLPLCAALCAREGMDRESALRCITAQPAAILGLSGAGVIQPDAQADLAIYDGDPLLLASSHVMTIAGGKIRH